MLRHSKSSTASWLGYLQVLATLVGVLNGLHSAYAQDFNWGITPTEGFPIIAFDQAHSENEVQFKYNFTGTLSENKILVVALLQEDCIATADASLVLSEQNIVGNEILLDVDILQATISDSVHYTPTGDTSANVTFCVRIDYNYQDSDGEIMNMNFHETIVDVNVDLTANFTLTGVAVAREGADEASASIDCPVFAYFCSEDNVEIEPDPFAQGSILQVCVQIDYEQAAPGVYIDDILRFVVSQPEGPGTSSINIEDGITDPLTAKVCGTDGICNVKTRLPSKYFVDLFPNSLRIDGVALCAFGDPTPPEPTASPTSSPSASPTPSPTQSPTETPQVCQVSATTAQVSISNETICRPIYISLCATEESPSRSLEEESRNVRNLRSGIRGEVEEGSRRLQGAAPEEPESAFSLEVSLTGNKDESKTPASPSSSNSNNVITIVIVVVCIVVLILGAACVYICRFSGAATKRRIKGKQEEQERRMRGNAGNTGPNQECIGRSYSPPDATDERSLGCPSRPETNIIVAK